jgi:hypothetical protein
MVSLALVRIPSQPCPLPLRPGYCRPSLVMDFPYRCRLFPVPTRPRLVSFGCKPVRVFSAYPMERLLGRPACKPSPPLRIVWGAWPNPLPSCQQLSQPPGRSHRPEAPANPPYEGGSAVILWAKSRSLCLRLLDGSGGGGSGFILVTSRVRRVRNCVVKGFGRAESFSNKSGYEGIERSPFGFSPCD